MTRDEKVCHTIPAYPLKMFHPIPAQQPSSKNMGAKAIAIVIPKV